MPTYLYTFYRPHERVVFDNIDPKTKKPMPSMTKQEFKDESDINNIIKMYSQTGMLNHVNANAALGRYEDLPDPTDYQEALHLIMAADESFMSLPSKLRDRFENDPAKFLAFCEDPENGEEMLRLGLRSPPVVPAESPTPREGAGGGTPPAEGA